MTVRIANWVSQLTATTGTGSVTLGAAEAGAITMAQAKIANGEPVGYMIEDGANKEVGYGIYTASGTVLSRATIIATLDAGTYTDVSPTPIILSGSAIVSIRPDANTNLVGVSGVRSFRDADKFLVSAYGTKSTSDYLTTPGKIEFMQFVALGPVEIVQLGTIISTVSSVGSLMKFGIYRWDGRTRTAYIIDGTADVSTTTLGQIDSPLLNGNLIIAPGFYLIALATDSNVTLDSGALAGISILPNQSALNTTKVVKLSTTGLYSGTLPASQSFDHNSTAINTFPEMHVIHT